MNIHSDFRPLADEEVSGASSAEDWQWVGPLGEDEPAFSDEIAMSHAPHGFLFTQKWAYRNEDGKLLGYVVRIDKQATGARPEKTILPFTYCKGVGGDYKWRSKAWPEPRPLYGLGCLAANPDAPVLVVEGEKVADAADKRFPDHVVITSPGGSGAAGKADWTALKGRKVTIWPDHDDPGRKYAGDVARLATEAGAESVSIVQVPANFSTKWDLADPNPPGVTDEQLTNMLKSAKAANGWEAPAPIKSSLPKVEPLAPEMLPESFRSYVLDVADRQQSSPDFVAVAALTATAAVIGNRVHIAPKSLDDWVVVPNLWGALIGPPSAMKSPAMRSALDPVYTLEKEMQDGWATAIEDARIDGSMNELTDKEAKKEAAKTLRGGDLAGARAILAKALKDDTEPPRPRIVVNDATVEKLGELLKENPRGLLLVRDELAGFLARMESDDHASERAFYLEAFNGSGPYTYDRIGRGTVAIPHCTLSIIGGVQPSRIAPIAHGAITGRSNDGLIQRFQLAVWPDLPRAWQWQDRLPDHAARKAYEKVFHDLHALQLGTPEKPAVLRFSKAAQGLFQVWMTQTQTEARSGKLSTVLESHLLKMPETVASLALIFELIDGGRTEVGEKSTLRALAWADYLRSHADRLYSNGSTMAEDGARLILERRDQLPNEFSVREVHQKSWAGLTQHDMVTAAIRALVAAHCCREVLKPTTGTGGRPTTIYEWNPALTGK